MACRAETELIKEVVNQHPNIVSNCKDLLNNIIVQLQERFSVSTDTFLSDDVKETGNLGTDTPFETLEYIVNYGTIREKTQAIGNVIYSPLFKQQLFYYILGYEGNDDYILQRKHTIFGLLNIQETENTRNINVSKKSIYDLASPLPFTENSYAYKRGITKLNRSSPCQITKDDLIEPLSQRELEFLHRHGYSADNLPFQTGECLYRSSLEDNTRSLRRVRRGVCARASISGNTLFMLDLCSILGLGEREKYLILFAMFVTMVAIHHSILEIVDAAQLTGLIPKGRKRPEEFVADILRELDPKLQGGRRRRKTRRRVKT